jgi:nucleotide-binding universal stress UspA family protein
VQERRIKKAVSLGSAKSGMTFAPSDGSDTGEAMLCAIRGPGQTLDFALREARETGRRLYLLFVREQRFITEQDNSRKWQDDREAKVIFESVMARSIDHLPLFCYAVSESASQTIVDIAATLGASRLILGAPGRDAVTKLLRGNLVREVSALLPEEIDLLVYA